MSESNKAIAWAAGVVILACCAPAEGAEGKPARDTRQQPKATGRPIGVMCLDGGGWLLAADPKNVGLKERWYLSACRGAKPARVPWPIQGVLVGYHGLAWYWRDFQVPANPHPGGRYLLRFFAVDYKADVWLNGQPIGRHEGGESAFVLDATDAVKPGAANRLSLRVLVPTHKPIDGIVLKQTPHRNKSIPIVPGSDFNHGGIMDSVELLLVPAVWVEDVFVRSDWKTGKVRVEATVRSTLAEPAEVAAECSIAPAAGGPTLDTARTEHRAAPGQTLVRAEMNVVGRRLWQLNDPFLYSVTVRIRRKQAPASGHARSVRTGFRDFRFSNGCFRLNGKRLYLRGSHTGNCTPIGIHNAAYDPDLLRRDLLNVKTMGFNMIRFIAGVATRRQLDLCDEIGLLVYEEAYAAWLLGDGPHMARRWDESTFGMIRRDRNHPSVVIWGLLNETRAGAVFRHAAACLPRLRKLDETRMVFLNSGRWDDRRTSLEGLQAWRSADSPDPNVTHNPTRRQISALGVTWPAGQLSFHPGRGGEYSVVRWTCPADEQYTIAARFASIAAKATTDVHVMLGAKALFDDVIDLKGRPAETAYTARVKVRKGQTIDCAVGFGNGSYGADSTGLWITICSGADNKWDAAGDFSVARNPCGAWSYGTFRAGPRPDPATFKPYQKGMTYESPKKVGSLSNPGSLEWEDVLSDQHHYPRVPHTAAEIRRLRTASSGTRPVFISEYGIGSAVDLWRTTRHYERLGQTHLDGAKFYRAMLDRFLVDYKRWKLDQCFAGPDDYFRRCLSKMAAQRLLGLNAIRANPNVVGYSLTGTVDQGWTGEGLTTTFREFKPGTVDALHDGLAPLRLCLFARPLTVYRGRRVRLEAVLADEDTLRPGEYSLRLQVIGPHGKRVLDKTLTVTLPKSRPGQERPFATTLFARNVPIDGPSGRYSFVAAFQRGAAAAGGEAGFWVFDPADMPAVRTPVMLWGRDAQLGQWLKNAGIPTRPFVPEDKSQGVILASGILPGPGKAKAFDQLWHRVSRGSVAVCLCPEIFRKEKNPVAYLPLEPKGKLVGVWSWLYLFDEWAKAHVIFDGLPAGGILDNRFYRRLISNRAWVGQGGLEEAVAGSIRTAQGYDSGLILAVHKLGAGKIILNTLRIRENLGADPVAERLLRNLLNFAATRIPKRQNAEKAASGACP